MTEPAAPVPPGLRDLSARVRSVGRFAVGVAVGALMAGLVFLIVIQEGFRRGYTDLDFNHVLGTLVKGTADEAAGTQDAFGVVGDTAGPSGVYATLIAAIVLVTAYALVVAVVRRRHWVVQGLALAGVVFGALGLGFGPYADSQLDTPTGLFGIDAGGATPIVLALAALAFGITASRVYNLIHDAEWWEPTHTSIDEVLLVKEADAPSLELPEKGPEGGRVST